MAPTTDGGLMGSRRVLILTASFGDGHNSAARGVAAGLGRVGGGRVTVEVHDLVREAEPVKGDWLQRGYKFAITHWPWAWRQLYDLAEHLPFNDDRLFFLGKVEHALGVVLEKTRPDAVVATFPLYAHLLAKWFGRAGMPFPMFTVVTDSITVNQVWFSPATSCYLAPDDLTAAELRRRGVPAERVTTTGFPVHPDFADAGAVAPDVRPRRALYFPAASRRTTRRALVSLLGSGPKDLELTVVLGRHEDRLRSVATEIAGAFPSRRVKWLGWTRDVPDLMRTNDLVIGKAGGATTHECGAAGRPLIITQIVPGQEEGNAELILRRGAGCHEEHPEALGPVLERLARSGAWTKIRAAAWSHRRADGSLAAARIILGNHFKGT